MTRTQIGGVLLFLAALAVFLVFLPSANDPVDPSPAINQSLPPAEEADTQSTEFFEASSGPVDAQGANPREEGEGGIEIDLQDLSQLSIGDTVSLYIPQEDRRHEGPVEDITISSSGNRSLTGFLGDPAKRHPNDRSTRA